MIDETVAVVGSGISGTAVALALTRRGHRVVMFEKGPAFPYPHLQQFSDKIEMGHEDPKYRLPGDLRRIVVSGTYGFPVEDERAMVVGGSATHWEAIALRMTPDDFRTRTLFGYGTDWPVDYAELEPYYCRAEALIGVSGTDEDNPYASFRSRPYPLPPFELSHDDRLLAERLRKAGIVVHTTPQARTRLPYDKRLACLNFGTCQVCPIGARYSPNHHLQEAVDSGLCEVLTDVSVRRIVPEPKNGSATVVYQLNNAATETERSVKAVVIAAGAIESIRLLLLSKGITHPSGLGNHSDRLGQGFTFHHAWWNTLVYQDRLVPGRFGGWTGQSHQFIKAPTRGRHGALKVIFSSKARTGQITQPGLGNQTLESLQPRLRARPIEFEAESVASPTKFVELAAERDRFGDPFAHLHYESDDFDHRTHEFARRVNDQFVAGSGADPNPLNRDPERFGSGAHHMGGCAMGNDRAAAVTDRFGAIHGLPNIYVVGGSVFPGTSGAVNPTLTMTALALRTADHLLARIG